MNILSRKAVAEVSKVPRCSLQLIGHGEWKLPGYPEARLKRLHVMTQYLSSAPQLQDFPTLIDDSCGKILLCQ